MEPTSPLEKAAGNPLTALGATLLSAYSGVPMTAVLPVLAGALATERHKKRVEDAIRDVEAYLRAHETKLRQLTDAQYKIVNEASLAFFQTVDQDKIDYLRNAIKRSLFLDDLTLLEADMVSRILRDISAAEAKFLLDHPDAAAIQVGDAGTMPQAGVLYVRSDSPEIMVVSGLMAMGLLIPSEAAWDTSDRMMLSPICKRIRALLAE